MSTVPRSVSVRALEDELAALWKSEAVTRDPSGEQPITRAALLTLIAVVHDDEAANRMVQAVTRLTEQTPCRAILVQLETVDAASESLSAFVTGHCHRVAGGNQVCCEQVIIRSKPDGDVHLSNLVLPLLLADLPVILHWPEVAGMMAPESRPTTPARGAQFLCDLDPYVDQVILDSALAQDPVAFCSRAKALAERAPGPGMRPIDLNWVRLLPWREALADAVDRCAIDVTTIARATVEAILLPAGPRPLRPMLLAGWLRERLVQSAGGTFQAMVTGLPGEAPNGRILGVRFDMVGGSFLAIRMEPGALVVTRSNDEPFRIARPIEPAEDTLCRVIARREADPMFVRALRRTVVDDVAGATP